MTPEQRELTFTPERVEPFFSAMTPGSYLRTGSAIESAYVSSEGKA